jgi:ATP-dependent DNA helicase RecQ
VKLQERFLDDISDPVQQRTKRQATTALFRMVEDGRCRHQSILAHFDEEMGACDSSCDVCTGVTAESLAAEGMMRGRRARATARTDGAAARTDRHDGGEYDRLFEDLRTLRKDLADGQGVPAYIVFNDNTLRAMAERLPMTATELLDVPGVGPAKLERYGDAFLEVIRASC